MLATGKGDGAVDRAEELLLRPFVSAQAAEKGLFRCRIETVARTPLGLSGSFKNQATAFGCRSLLHDYEARIIEIREGRYYAVRERVERAMSCHAPDRRAAAAHAEMADRYEALAVVFGAKRTPEVPIDYL